MESISIRHFEALIAVAEEESFTRASRHVGLSQPTLTTLVKQLEEAVGLQLLDRTTRRVALTREGVNFIKQAQHAVKSFHGTLSEARGTAQYKGGQVSVACLPTIATQVMPKVLLEFAKKYPDVAVHIRDGNDFSLLRLIRDGSVDFAVGTLLPGNDDLNYQVVLEDEIGLVCRADHTFARRRSAIQWSELEETSIIGFSQDTGIRQLIEGVAPLPSSFRYPLYETSNYLTMEALIETGLGSALMFKLGAVRGRARKLYFKVISNPEVSRKICIIERRDHGRSPAQEAMREVMVQHLSKRTDAFKLNKALYETNEDDDAINHSQTSDTPFDGENSVGNHTIDD